VAARTTRHQWAVDMMDVQAADRLLEIGCGRGTLAWLLSRHVTTGKVTAIDKAPTMARLAHRRNAESIEAGSVEIRCDALETVDLPRSGFDKILAVNLSLFWMADASAHIERLKHLLAPGGRLYVFSERPAVSTVKAIAARIEAQLRSHDLATVRTVAAGRSGHGLTCVQAALP
jgi:ubiquinone/menaquinone biosynthesis C-methylase UbiE